MDKLHPVDHEMKNDDVAARGLAILRWIPYIIQLSSSPGLKTLPHRFIVTIEIS